MLLLWLLLWHIDWNRITWRWDWSRVNTCGLVSHYNDDDDDERYDDDGDERYDDDGDVLDDDNALDDDDALVMIMNDMMTIK